jgi:adenine-specific DNA-methyltransferase
LYLARNLLRDDGVMFISIDDDEIDNLRKLCNEVFGEDNFCGTFVWEKKKKPSFLNANMGVVTEYIVAYAQNRASSPAFVAGKAEEGKKYPFNNAGNSLGRLEFPLGTVRFGVPDGVFEPQDMSEGNIITRLLTRLEVRNGTNVNSFSLEGEWRYSQRKLDEFIANKDEIYIAKAPFRPNHISREDKEKKCKNLLTVDSKTVGTYEDATAEVNELFGKDVMDYPKPSSLLAFLLRAVTTDGDFVLDFFAGSGTLGHAALQLGARGSVACDFILVQLPQPCDPTQETGRNALSLGLRTIADVCKERVKRVLGKLASNTGRQALFAGDNTASSGFRVFKLAASNFRTWDAHVPHEASTLLAQLERHVDYVRDGRSTDDILYELLLKSGFPLTTSVQRGTLVGKTTYSVAGGALIICLERELTLELIRAIAAQKPERVICLDDGFSGNDQLKANAVQTFRKNGVTNFRTL